MYIVDPSGIYIVHAHASKDKHMFPVFIAEKSHQHITVSQLDS